MTLTLLPVSWSRAVAVFPQQPEPIVYCVEGLPANERAVISMVPGGWRVVLDSLSNFDQEKKFSTADQAADALKSWIEGGGSKAAE
jgi:hypothetical protein